MNDDKTIVVELSPEEVRNRAGNQFTVSEILELKNDLSSLQAEYKRVIIDLEDIVNSSRNRTYALGYMLDRVKNLIRQGKEHIYHLSSTGDPQ